MIHCPEGMKQTEGDPSPPQGSRKASKKKHHLSGDLKDKRNSLGGGEFQAKGMCKGPEVGGRRERLRNKEEVCLMHIEEDEDVKLERSAGPNHRGSYTEKAPEFEFLPYENLGATFGLEGGRGEA